jgi:manganese/iron transport system permease protein
MNSCATRADLAVLVGDLRRPVLLPRAEGLVADGRRRLACRVARHRAFLHCRTAIAARRFAAGLVCALGIGYLKENSRVKEDTVMGIVFSGMFGFGLVLYTKIQSDVHLDHILFGDMLGIAWPDILETGLIALVTTSILAVKWRDFLLHAFDPAQAKAVGLRVNWLHYGLLALLSLTIVGALKAVGLILAIAMLIAPGAIAFLITRTMGMMLIVAVLVATVASFFGVYLSFFIDSAPAPTIVLLMTAIFIIAFVWSSWRSARIEAQRTIIE